MTRRLAVVAVLAILVLAVGHWRYHSRARARTANRLAGVWVGDVQWLDKANLSDVQLFVMPKKETNAYTGYLIMVDKEDNFVANQAFELRASYPFMAAWHGPDTPKTMPVSFTFDADRDGRAGAISTDASVAPDVSAFPREMEITLDPMAASLTLFNPGSKLYAFLYRDAPASAQAIAAWHE